MYTPPPLYLKKHADRRLRTGHIWIYSNEINTDLSPLKTFSPGQMVVVHNAEKKALGTAYINPHSLICARLVSRNPRQVLDRKLLIERIKTALALRQRLFPQPFYRLIYGESDNLPGLVVDRFGEVLVVQMGTAGMEHLREEIIAALDQVLSPQAVVLRNESSVRHLEHLDNYSEIAFGQLPDSPLLIEENAVKFEVDVLAGQKTGWFFDHRMNRLRLQNYVQDARVLDMFSYAGAWGLQAAAAGAAEVHCVDASAKALDAVKCNTALNGETMQQCVHTRQGMPLRYCVPCVKKANALM